MTTMKQTETTTTEETESETIAPLSVTASISLVQTTSATPTSAAVEEAEAIAGAPVTPAAPIKEPEGAIGAVQVTNDIEKPSTEEPNSVIFPTEKPKEPTDMFNEELDMEEITNLLQNMSYADICGRRPWQNVKSRSKIYPKGHETKGGFSGSKKARSNELSGRGQRRRNSKYLWGSRTPKIVNGDIADYGEWPWQVSLRQWRTGTS